MLLSDQLIALGRDANPKSNLSQGTQAQKMLDLMITNKNGATHQQLVNITKLVVKQLNKEGFNYYKVETFWKKNINKNQYSYGTSKQ